MGDATDAVGLSRADATRARLLKAATDAFAEKGFHATTTRDIATLAGMSPAALYVQHKSK
jgi:AcrR family transcriptional regulator